MHKLMEFVCGELEELERKVAKDGKLSRTDLDDVKTLTEVKKNILKADKLSEESEYSMAMNGGYSRRGGYSMRDSYADGRSYMMDGSYADGEYRVADGVRNYVRPDGSYADSSYARGRGAGAKRDSMGRYSSESVDDHTKEKLREMIENL